MRKIYLLPNFVTTVGMGCGFYSIISGIHHDYIEASWAILAAGIFDMMDGRVARMAKATSSFGVEYDSLSDLLSFGIAPAVLVYQWSLEPFGRVGWLAAFFFVACAAFRLARFNVSTTQIKKGYFQGLPSPVAAATIAAFIIFYSETGWPVGPWLDYAGFLTTVGLAILMVSGIPFPSFKELNWRSKATLGYLLIAVLVLFLVVARPELTLFAVGVAYLGFTLLWVVIMRLRGKRPREILGKTA